MNTGVEILLRRMETHPEEFTPPIQHGTSKWADLIHAYKDHIDTEDYEALKLGMKKVLQDKFTERVMQTLAGVDETSEDPKSLEDVIKQYRATGISSVGQTQLSSTGQSQYSNTIGTMGTVTLPSGSITLGKTTLEEEQLKQMKAHLDAHREAMNKVEVNKKPLIKRIFK